MFKNNLILSIVFASILFSNQVLAKSVVVDANTISAKQFITNLHDKNKNVQFQVFNLKDKAIFPTSSTLILGNENVILVNAQFSIKDAELLADQIKKTGKNLTTVVISAGDPDYYFGLQSIVKAFPNVKIVATAEVVNHINATKDAKLAYWGPILKDGAPRKLYVPEVIEEDELVLENKRIVFKANDSYSSYLWMPESKTILGGVGISSGLHLWTADTQTKLQRKKWANTLNQMLELEPSTVIPGHYLGELPKGIESIKFTLNYLNDFEKNLHRYKKADEVIAAMKKKYPNLPEENSLELSAKVNTGEMEWH